MFVKRVIGLPGDSMFEGSLVIDVANEPFTYQGISKKEQSLMLEDMHLSDQTGVVSSIIKGPDFRTRITKNTQNGLYFIYGVPGVMEEQIGEELQTIAAYLSQVIPKVTVQDMLQQLNNPHKLY